MIVTVSTFEVLQTHIRSQTSLSHLLRGLSDYGATLLSLLRVAVWQRQHIFILLRVSMRFDSVWHIRGASDNTFPAE